MPELPIYPASGPEAPGYGLERRRKRLAESHEASFQQARETLRRVAVHETLRLTGYEVSPDDVAEGADPLVASVYAGLDLLEQAATTRHEPDLGLLQELHRMTQPEADGSFRRGERPPQFAIDRPASSSPQFVEAKLSNLIGWLASESARSMFPAERMTLFFARFLEIAPFDRGNFRTAHLSVGLFASAAGFPPVSLRFEDADVIRSEVEMAIRFQTEPLVARFSDAISRSLEVWEGVAGTAS